MARLDQEGDLCSLNQLYQTFSKSGFNLRELIAAIPATDAFRYRAVGQ